MMAHHRFGKQKNRGIVLLLVLVVVAMMSLAAYTYTTLMQAEQRASMLVGRRIQTRNFADSGTEFTRMFLAKDKATRYEEGGAWDNPDYFQAQIVRPGQTSEDIGLYTMIAPNLTEEGLYDGFRYGLIDESTRLNLNILTYADAEALANGLTLEEGGKLFLLSLPGMTDEIADSIMDWLDEDDDPRPFGAEFDYYQGLNPPYAPKNGPMDTVEELLLIRGMSPVLLFGLDANHNGLIDDNEMSSEDADMVDPESQLGWVSMLTLFSREKNYNTNGVQRVFLNNQDLDELYNDLSASFNDQWAAFIIALRQVGPYTGTDELTEDPSFSIDSIDFESEPTFSISKTLDLIDMRIEFDGEIIESPITQANMMGQLVNMMSELSVQSTPFITGRINIMQAPRSVLLGIPGLDEELVDEIIAAREFELDGLSDGSDLHRQFETWILNEGIVDLTEMRALTPYICAGGDVFRAEIIGYYQTGSASSRAEVVFDATEPVPRIVFWRDKSHLSMGYDLETLGLAFSEDQ